MHNDARCGTIALRDQHRVSRTLSTSSSCATRCLRCRRSCCHATRAEREAHARDGGVQAPEVRGEERSVQRRAAEPTRRDDRRRPRRLGSAARAGAAQRAGTQQRSRRPKRQPLPAGLPRREIRHEPESTTCRCGCELKRIGEDVAEKLDYTPGVFSVERHVRGKWVCAQCETLVQAPVPAHVIDKGIPTSGLLAQVLVAKFQDHLPLYRQEQIFERAGLAIPRSTLAQWVGECGARAAAAGRGARHGAAHARRAARR